MIRSKMTLLLAALAFSAGAALAGDKKDRPVDKVPIPPLKAFDPPAAKRVELANGVPCFILEDHELPLVEVEVILRAGSIWDPEDEVGLASIAGSVWRNGGTKTHPKEKLDELVEKHGMSLEAGIGHDQGSIHLSCLKEDLELGLSLVKELVTEPLFPKDKIEQAKTEMLSSIERRNDQAPPIAGRIFSMEIYGKKSPYARVATPASVEKVSQADIVAWHERFVRPQNAIVGAFGDASATDIEKKLGAALGGWKAGGDAPAPEMPLVEATKKPAFIVIDKPDVNQSAIHIGHIGQVRSVELMDEYAKVLVMNEILGGGGFSSRLMLHVRSDQGLAYSVGSGPGWDYDHPGTFRMVCETKSESTVQAIGSLLHELDVIRKEPPTDEEIAVAKDSTLNQIPFLFDTTEKLIDNALRYEYRRFPQDTIKRLIEGVRKVTKEDVLEAARTYWSPDALVFVVAGNVAEIGGLDKLQKAAKTKIELVTDPEAWAEGKPQPAASGAEKPAGGEGAEKPAAEASGTLAKLLEASGGKKAIDGLKALKIKQTMKQDDQEAAEEILVEFPDKERRVMENGGQKVTIIYDGKQAAAIVPGRGTIKLPPAQMGQIKAEVTGMTASVLKAIARGDVTVASEKDDTFAGKPAKKLVLDVKGSRKQTFFVDAKTGALLGKEQDAGSDKLRIYIEESKDFGGVKLPTRLAVRKEGDKPDAEPLASVTISDGEANPKIDAETFKVPAGKAMKPDEGGDDEDK